MALLVGRDSKSGLATIIAALSDDCICNRRSGWACMQCAPCVARAIPEYCRSLPSAHKPEGVAEQGYGRPGANDYALSDRDGPSLRIDRTTSARIATPKQAVRSYSNTRRAGWRPMCGTADRIRICWSAPTRKRSAVNVTLPRQTLLREPTCPQ